MNWEKYSESTWSNNKYIVNELYREPQFKRIFTQVFIREARINHNMCFKPSWEKSNPLFIDLVVIFIANMLDNLYGTSPSDVSINHGQVDV